MLKFLRHLTLDGNYFPPKYFFHCEATDPETKYTLSSIAGTTHMRWEVWHSCLWQHSHA